MCLPLPDWYLALEDSDHKRLFTNNRLRNRFLVKAAALYCGHIGTQDELAKAVGVSRQTIASMFSEDHGVITPEQAVKFEIALGERLFPRVLFRPDIFGKI